MHTSPGCNFVGTFFFPQPWLARWALRGVSVQWPCQAAPTCSSLVFSALLSVEGQPSSAPIRCPHQLRLWKPMWKTDAPDSVNQELIPLPSREMDLFLPPHHPPPPLSPKHIVCFEMCALSLIIWAISNCTASRHRHLVCGVTGSSQERWISLW